jgi:2-iminobutanoate/2-iminopropanoate deaminase
VGLDPQGNIGSDFRQQTEHVFQNLDTALKAAGAGFKDVVKMNIYMLDVSQLAVFREIRNRYVNTKNPPASTLVGVVALARADFLVEVEVIAILG